MAPKRAREAGPSSGRAKSSRGASKPAVTATEDIEEFTFTPAEVDQIRTSLLSWYDENHRVLPWRRNHHSKLSKEALAAAAASGQEGAPLDLPRNDFIYYVWICEVMSQQTQVARAAEYFKRWVARWPTVQALAEASQEEVNELWAGLGYYRRARYLLEGAKYIVGQLQGSFPTTAAQLCAIPGVGAYTSAAIASIACGQREAVVDGNVIRVLARLRCVAGDPRSAALTKVWSELAGRLIDPERPGDFNQAVMELGATICIPNTEPKCGQCPVSGACAALRAVRLHSGEAGGQGGSAAGTPPKVTDYPTKVEKAEKREETVGVAVVQLLPAGAPATAAAAASPHNLAASKFLLVQRPATGLLAGLWQFPLLPLESEDGEGAPLKGQQQQQQQQQQLMDAYLQEQLGVQLLQQKEGKQRQQQGKRKGQASSSGGGEEDESRNCSAGPCLRVVERRMLGSAVHVFSHIRMTMKVEVVVVQGDIDTSARNANDDKQLAALQWVAGIEMGGKGLSSGVKKVYKLFTDACSKASTKQSITQFFKPKAPAAAAATDDDAASA